MKNAPTEALKRGWELYRTTTPRPNRDELNAALTAERMSGVSERAIRHFRTLDRHGMKDYLPINEMDMQIKHRRQNGHANN
jgi:hypothetical protein